MKTLNQYRFEKGRNFGKPNIDWIDILDRQWRTLERGIDYKCPTVTVRKMLYREAAKRGIVILVSSRDGLDGTGSVVFRVT